MCAARDIRDYLEDIALAINDIREFVSDLPYSAFVKDRKTSHAVIRSLEIIGEATRKIPQEIRQQHPDIPWSEMSAMRNKLIHEYFGVDLDIVWETIHQDLAPLAHAVAALLEQHKTNSD